jgi:thioredoxin-related protein
MRVIATLVLLFCLFSFLENNKASEYDDVFDAAKNTKGIVLLYFTDESCSWCYKLKPIFKNPEVQKIISKYLFLEIDITDNPELYNFYKITTIPAYMLVDGNKKIIIRGMGYKDKTNFINWLQTYKKEDTNVRQRIKSATSK